MASPTYTILADTDLRAFVTLARDLGVLASRKLSPPEVTLTTGATVLFRSADDPDRLRGPNLSGATLNEASLMHRDAYDICIASLREGGEQGWLSAGFTPRGFGHWTYEVFGQNRPDTAIFHSHTAANPFNPPEFAATLATQYSPQRQRQELAGEFVSLDGAEWPAEYFGPGIWAAEWPTHFKAAALALDPALGHGERGRPPPQGRPAKPGCYAAFAFAGLDMEGRIWCDAWLDQGWDARALVERSFGLCAQTRPGAFAVETNGGQEFLAELILAECRSRRVVLPLHGIHNHEDKEVRIRGRVGPFLAQGRLRFRAGSPGAKLLVQQLQDFPVGEYKDGPDALQMALVMLSHLLGERGGGAQPRLMRG